MMNKTRSQIRRMVLRKPKDATTEVYSAISSGFDSAISRVLEYIDKESPLPEILFDFVSARKDPKVFRNGNMLIGFSGSFRMGQLLRFSLVPPEHPLDKDAYEYMATDFIEAVRKCLKDGGYTTVKDNVESGAYFLVGYQGRLFEILSDFQVAESHEDYTAIGCGMDFTLGSLISTQGMDPSTRVEMALQAAGYFSSGVCEPFVVEKIPYDALKELAA